MIKRSLKSTIFFIFLFIQLSDSFSQEIEFEGFDAIRVNPFDLPEVYDKRDTNFLSEIRLQGTGGCWSSSAMVTIEAWMRQGGMGSFTLSDRNLQLNHGFDNSRNTYGNHFMATAYLSRGSGPVDIYAGVDSIAYLRPQFPYILSEARYLPGDPDLIKQTILEFGPVYSMLYFKRNAVDTNRFVLESLENPLEQINHAVSLVGWNDTIGTGDEQGAWIAQNSLGKKFGDNGFFYIPYTDKGILKHNAVWTEWKEFSSDNSIYYYDTLGSFNSYGFNDSICYALIKFTAEEDCELVSLSSHINTPGTFLKFDIYLAFDEETKVLSGKSGETEEYPCIFPGYYTLDSPEGVHLEKGADFFIMARYNAPYYTQPLPVEHTIEDYSYPHLMTGKCWVNPNVEKWPDAWYECGKNTQYPALNFDLCIRAITNNTKK